MKLISKFTILAVLTFCGLANAKNFNLGTKSGNVEFTRLSFQAEPAQLRLRVKLLGEAHCSKFRRDLCGLDLNGAILEVGVPHSACTVHGATFFTCRVRSLERAKASVILADGSDLPLHNVDGYIKLVKFSELREDGVERQINALNMELWGHRADGLDPLIRTKKTDDFFLQAVSLEEVQGSLF